MSEEKTREQQLEDMLMKIYHRASRPQKAGSTEIMVCMVPEQLLVQAFELVNKPKFENG